MIRRAATPLGLLALLWAPGDASAQDAETLAAQCVGAGGDATYCARAAGAGRDLSAAVGVLAMPGSELPGQASTLGRRLGGAPRIAASLRAGGAKVTRPGTGASGPAEASGYVPSAQATLAFGVFDGFQALPTVGGLLSFDLLASGSLLFFPEGDGFDGRTQAVSVGARLGILRESFTLPAVTVSASRRWVGDVRLGDVGGGDAWDVALDPTVTSLRATVGKDLFAFGVLAGVGWDRFSSQTTARVTDGVGGSLAQTRSLEGSRRSYFAGIAKQVGVIAWISAELGWMEGFDPVSAGGGASPDVGRSLFGNVAFVLKL